MLIRASHPPKHRHQESNEGNPAQAVAVLLTEYGLVFVVFHYTIFFAVWAAFYFILAAGLAEKIECVPDFLAKYIAVGADSTTGELLAASFVLMELVGPARSALDIAATPTIARALRKQRWWLSLENAIRSMFDSVKS